MLPTLAEYEKSKVEVLATSVTEYPPKGSSRPQPGAGTANRAETFLLLHPERPIGGTIFWTTKMIIAGNDYEVECLDGLVKTSDAPVKDFLVMQGWILEKTITEDNV
jgi:hypothetical protein